MTSKASQDVGVGSAASSSNGEGSTNARPPVLPSYDNNKNNNSNNSYYSPVPWMEEVWLATANRYERIATGSPRLGMGILGRQLVQHHINMLPTLRGAADFLPVFDHHNHHHHYYGAGTGAGAFRGSRPKMLTWPLTERQAMAVKQWAT